ncbi:MULTISPECIES: LamB/YcsF family protein [Bradyrhizobium]|uniref:LamB/YcsF family protein n=3 Tax=Bradyrhizobium TaxID=374 RepID=A0AAE5X9H2_9BRAD|nr:MULTISPECIES: 5-oxoprolinase subunit PxpA [Bradyrhizobium]MCG2629401.1 LamB/YcsF family protein [Bradyrhizobium zhengyangense]MCG2644682.1 LamB/YcsF family protein [Bradyrhizobium zhengyangense]MCG2670915.1 LamB/YcsF family protein [Bradyrhizobium zhengyangense]MDN4984548.1 5-oxoprolinase subunit PxpA [Bradyrhizobium sp. WYCCWR 13022]MDN5002540.1 5-oxoprolinase subunit PxpA [Bradyrhizobium sp. WYCCWR 12677]
MKIDINSDIGEGFGRWRLCDDAALMALISSANVACGFHAGDAVIMTDMAAQARARGVALGAHVGLPDLLGFGRVPMKIDPHDMRKHALYQLGALSAIAKAEGYKVTHAGTHGVFGMMSRETPEYLQLIFDAFKAYDPDIIVPGEPGSPWQAYARKIGLRTVGRIYADRAYEEDGSLVSRKKQGAVINDLDQIAARASQFLNDGTVTAITGKRIKLDAKSILVHSDTPGSVEIAKTLRDTIERGGGQVTPLTELVE